MNVLKIFSKSPLSYSYETDKKISYYNVPEAGTPAIEEYEGEAAKRELWKIYFDKLDDDDKWICNAVFPLLQEKDPLTLKMPAEIVQIARRKITRNFGYTCPRCGGSGSYSKSVAYTVIDDGVCHRCRGAGRAFPKLTAKKRAEISEFFKAEATK